MTLPIHPDTHPAALLEAHPELEELLLDKLPAWRAVSHPALRQAIAAHATLKQLAERSGVPVWSVVRELRRAAGESEGEPEEGGADSSPAWVSGGREHLAIDADAMLRTGEHPVGLVRETAARLAPGEYLRLASGFRPTPLIDMMARAGYLTYVLEVSPGRFESYFGRAS